MRTCLLICTWALLVESATLVNAQPSRQSDVFYEIFVRSFYDSNGDGIGDLNGITQKLDYLNDGNPATKTDLGVTGIWLMPINPSPSYHGYDVTNYYGINPDYGTLQDFRNLLKEAEKRGINVIMDFVMNHCSVQHPWYQKARAGDPFYKEFFVWSAVKHSNRGPWGQRLWHGDNPPFHYGVFSGGLPDLNFENPAVRDSLYAAARFWIRDVGLDGFRLDAVKFLYEEQEIIEDHPKTLAFWKSFADSIRAWNPNAFTVGEAWAATKISSQYVQGNKLDYVFEFDTGGAILKTVVQENANILNQQMALNNSLYPEHRYGTFLTNHDQTRSIEELKNSLPKAKLAAQIYLTLPGTPYLYYGEEIAMRGAKPDEFIRRPMAWNSNADGGFSTAPPWIPLPPETKERNIAANQSNSSALWQVYRNAIALRKANTALQSGQFIPITSSAPHILAYLRKSNTQTLLIMANLKGDTAGPFNLIIPEASLPEGTYLFKRTGVPKKAKTMRISALTPFDGLQANEFLVLSLDKKLIVQKPGVPPAGRPGSLRCGLIPKLSGRPRFHRGSRRNRLPPHR